LVKNNTINPNLPVFLDSPMAIDVLEIFKKFPELYNSELAQDKNPFDFANLMCTRSVQSSRDIRKAYNPKIIIAGSGMMSGGRIMHHLDNYISLPNTRLLIVGYQAKGTLGRQIQEGAKKIELYRRLVPVKATITSLEAFSAHADQPRLMRWLGHIQAVKNVFLVHGEDPQRQALAQIIQKELHIQNVSLPIRGQIYEIN